jgi:PIN domain nuclease of toxin-antitoxin system
MTVMDSSAVIAVLSGETGAEVVLAHLADASISAVNWAEIITKSIDLGVPAPEIGPRLAQFDLRIHPFDEDAAYGAGLLRTATRKYGLSLGDRACLALGASLKQPVLTADQTWARLDIGVEIQVIR